MIILGQSLPNLLHIMTGIWGKKCCLYGELGNDEISPQPHQLQGLKDSISTTSTLTTGQLRNSPPTWDVYFVLQIACLSRHCFHP